MSKKKPTFEASLAELERLIQRLEGELPLEEAIATFEKGQALIRQCEAQLQQAEQVVKQLLSSGHEEPLDVNDSPPF